MRFSLRHPWPAGAALGLAPFFAGCAAPPIQLVASPSTATIYRVSPQDNSLVQLGVGSVPLKFEGDATSMRIVVRQEGFLDRNETFSKATKYTEKQFTLFLNRRIVDVTSQPFDARLYVNGELKGQGRLAVEVPEGGSTTVELKKPGFATVKRVYEWAKGSTAYPPPRDRLELTERRTTLTLSPSGTEAYVGETRLGADQVDVAVPTGTCTKVRAQKEGWASVERQYCSREGAPEAPLADAIALTARIVTVSGPATAQILVNGRVIGTGSAPVRVPDEGCVAVRVQQPGYLSELREYCGAAGSASVVIPVTDRIDLPIDKSWEASDPSVQANVNITVEVGEKLTEEKAWKTMSAIVLSHFDVLENSDRETGYLRTAWSTKTFDGGRVIRTRIVVKRQSDSPLRYSVKIMSEQLRDANEPGKTLLASEDQNYESWPRLLKTYQDVISEMQARMK
jgi:hypothetical protein